METTNYRVKIFTKAGQLIASFSLNNLFNVTEGSFFDPQVIYDEMSGRWFVSGDYGHNGTEVPYIAVSATDDPTGTWHVYNTNFSSSYIDQPRIGISYDKLVVVALDFTIGKLTTLIYDKSAMLAGKPTIPFQTYIMDASYMDIYPAKMLGESSDLYMASYTVDYSTGQYYANLFTMTGTVPNANVTVSTMPLQVPPYLPNGNYTVTLKFAEIYWTAAGQRKFNVSMQGTQVISNLDIFSKVGKNAAYDVSVPVSVTNGTLTITFTTISDNAKVSAILVTSQ